MRTSFLLTVIAAITALRPPDIKSNENNFKETSYLTLSQVQGSNRVNGRFRKAPGDDPLKSSVSNLQMVARITNAIYLQQELIAGKVPADALISELLHFGSVKPSDIINLDVPKIEAAMKALKDLPNKLKPDSVVLQTERTFEAINGVVKHVRGSADIKNWNRSKMEKEITQLAKDGVTHSKITDFGSKAGNAKTYLSELADKSKNQTGNSEFMKLASALSFIKTAASSLDGVYWSADGFSSAVDMIQPIILARDAANSYAGNINLLLFDQTRRNAYKSYFDSFSTSIKSFDGVAEFLDVLKQLMTARQMSSWGHKDLVFTSGFPHGLSDLVKLHQNLQDVWIRNVVNSTKLSTALDRLKELEAPMQSIEDGLSSNEVSDYITGISLLTDNLFQLKKKSEKLNSGLAQIQNCKPSNQIQPIDSDLVSIEEHLNNIDQMLEDMKTKTVALVDYLNNPEIGQLCDEVINIANGQDLKTSLVKIKSYANYQTLYDHLEEIVAKVKEVKDVQKVASIQKEAETVKSLFPQLKTYHDDTISFVGHFSCFQKNDVYSVLDAVETVKVLRTDHSSRSTSIDNGLVAIKKVAGTKDALKKLETIVSAQKGFKGMETDALANLKDGSTHSKTIGLAVHGVSNMKDAVEKRADLEGLVNVKDLIQKHQRWLKDSEDVKNLDSLLSLLDQIQKMMTSLDTFKQSIKPSNSSKLADYSDIFMNAKSVLGASGEFEKMAGTVGKLKESVTDPSEKQKLDEVASTLRTMDTMGLDFSKFQKSFDASKGSLSALDEFFANFSDQLEHVEEQSNTLVIIIVIMLAILLLIAVANILLFVFFRKRFEKCYPCLFEKEKSLSTSKEETPN